VGAELELNVSYSILLLTARELWRGRYSIKAIAEERVRNSIRRTIWTRHSSVEEWDSKVADMEE